MDPTVLKNAMRMLSKGPDPAEFEYTEENINKLIEESQKLSDALFADRSQQHDKMEYIRAHFGNLLTRTLLLTWKNALGLDKKVLHNSLVSILSVYFLNKVTALPCTIFVKSVLESLVVPAEPDAKSTHVLDEEKLKAHLQKEYNQGVAKAPEEVKARLEGKWQKHFESEQGQETYELAKKYLGLMACIYYFIVKQ